MAEYAVHPAAEIFPMMNTEEYAGLVEDIREHGLREPIVLYDGMVLDGRNRLRACEDIGIEPDFTEWPNGEDPHFYVVSKNLHRRHLSGSQRAMIAARFANIPHGGDRTSKDQIWSLVSNEEAGKALKVSRSAVIEAKKVLESGTLDEIESVCSGQKAVTAVAKKIRKREKAAGIEKHPKQPKSGGARVEPPPGISLEDWCRVGFEHEEAGVSASDVAKDFGLDERTYRMMRDIVSLSDRSDLSGADAVMVANALRAMNESQQVGSPHESVEAIVHRIYGYRGHRTDKTAARRIEEFERAFGHVIQAGTSADQIEIPYITEERAKRAIEDIALALRHMRALKSKLEELYP